jgi:hypothetical protein
MNSPEPPLDSYPAPDPDAIEAWLRQMPEIDRARLIAVLTATTTVGQLSRLRQETVYAITRRMTDVEAAAALQVSPSAVRNVVGAYCKAHPDAPRKPTRAPKGVAAGTD